MVNKKGWIRIVEASIAILIIFGVLLYVSQTRKSASETDLSGVISPLLEEIAKNLTLRETIVASTPETSSAAEATIKAFLASVIKDPALDYEVRICEPDKLCGMGKYPTDAKGNIYADGRIITSALSLNKLTPKKVEIFMWRR